MGNLRWLVSGASFIAADTAAQTLFGGTYKVTDVYNPTLERNHKADGIIASLQTEELSVHTAAQTLFGDVFVAATPPDVGAEFTVVTHGKWERDGAAIYYQNKKLPFTYILARKGDDTHFVFRDEKNNQYLVERIGSQTGETQGAYNPTLERNHKADGIIASLQTEELSVPIMNMEEIMKKPTFESVNAHAIVDYVTEAIRKPPTLQKINKR